MAYPSRRVRRSSHCFRTTSCRKNKRRPPQIVGCSSSLLEEGDVLTVEDAERLLQRLDLLLAARNAVLVRHTGIHARRLELVVVRQSRVELLLRALEVSLLRRQGALLVRLLRRLVLHVLRVRSAVHLRLAAELVERALRLSLRGLGVRLETREVRGDHLEHAKHTAVLRLHAGVGLIEDLRLLLLLLDERRGLAGLLVELLQDGHRLGHGGLRLLRVLDRLRVLRLLSLADLRRLSHRLVDRRDLGRQVRDLLRELRNGGRELLDLRREILDQHLVRVASVRLLLLEVRALVLELVVELLKHVNDALRLELVRVRLRSRHGHRVLAELVTLRKERADHLLRVLRDELQRVHLHELRLRAVVRLLLQHGDRALKRIHGLGVILVGGHVVRVLHLAHLSRRLLVALPHGDVLVKAGDLLRERRGIRLSLLDRGRELLHLRVRLLDRALLLHRGVVAELLVRSELHLLLVLLLLALLRHTLKELDDLLHRGHLQRKRKRQPAKDGTHG